MGSSQSSLTVAVTEEDTALFQEALQQQTQTQSSSSSSSSSSTFKLSDYTVEAVLQPGSGRLCRTFRVRHGPTDSTAVCKALWFKVPSSSSSSSSSGAALKEYKEELSRLKRLSTQQQAADMLPHWVVNQAWFVGETRTSLTATAATRMEDEETFVTSSMTSNNNNDNNATETTTSAAAAAAAASASSSDIKNTNHLESGQVDIGTGDGKQSSSGGSEPSTGKSTTTTTAATAASTAPTTTTANTTPAAAPPPTSTTPLGPVQVQPIFLLRPHVYTTLHDRLASRPWLHTTEKLFLTLQILKAVQDLHAQGLCHGEITTENIGLTSTGCVVLLDSFLSSTCKAVTVPDNDPTDYLYYFHPTKQGGAGAAGRCYLAPERFVTSESRRIIKRTNSSSNSSGQKSTENDIDDNDNAIIPDKLTPAMDIFSVGCVLVEVFLNGERCCDLGQLLEYRTACLASCSDHPQLSATLQQKLSKMESSAVRAACRRMLSYHPHDRLTASDYLERLQQQFPSSFELLHKLLVQDAISTRIAPTTSSTSSSVMATPDARMVRLAAAYKDVLWETMGVRHTKGISFLDKILAIRAVGDKKPQEQQSSADTGSKLSQEEQLFAETEELLRQLDSIDPFLPDDKKNTSTATPTTSSTTNAATTSSTAETASEERSALAQSSLLIYLQWILATVRHVQRPATKLVGLELIHLLAQYSSDEARLQRIVPVVVAMLQDVETSVRAAAIIVVTDTLAMISSFPPSDSQVFSQYIFKRVGLSSLMVAPSDPSLQVRLAFCSCMATLAMTARHFLDISHAVRLYEAVGNAVSASASGGSNTGAKSTAIDKQQKKKEGANRSTSGETAVTRKGETTTVFADDVARLLDDSAGNGSQSGSNTVEQMEADAEAAAGTVAATDAGNNNLSATQHMETSSVDSNKSQDASLVAACAGRTLMGSAYQAELAALHDTVSRWVVHIATDQSQHASLTKRAMLKDLGRLCTFFGLEGTMAFILPQILAFLNDRKDWELRAALFENLPSVCRMIGRAATEEFVLPCIEIGLVDGEEQVIRQALSCLSRLVELGLLSRAILLGSSSPSRSNHSSAPTTSLLEKYSAFLIHPSEGIRHGAMETFATSCRATGSPDMFVYIVPIMRPFLRFQPSIKHMTNESEMERCLQPAWKRERFDQELARFSTSSTAPNSPTSLSAGAWMTVGMDGAGGETKAVTAAADAAAGGQAEGPGLGVQNPRVDEYLRMYARHLAQSSFQEQYISVSPTGATSTRTGLENGIEASIRLAQSIMFPRQDGKGARNSLPEWYNLLREKAEASSPVVSEASAIRSLATLGSVYGLSIMGPPTEGTKENIVPAVRAQGAPAAVVTETDTESVRSVLDSEGAKLMEAASKGEWGSEAVLDPDVVDTSLLVTKLRALEVPTLPPRLGDQVVNRAAPRIGRDGPAAMLDWRPRMNTLIASSSPISGHTAPVTRLAVSLDNSFFVSASHDGTCAVWEIPQLEDSVGILDSSIVYSGHSEHGSTRINDIAMVEGTHSVASGASNGSVHVWRVDLVSSSTKATPASQTGRERSRVVGSSSVQRINRGEGEVLAVSNFSSMSSSVVVYATQKGVAHGWDLRCAQEPFKLQHGPDLGHLSSMALGNDRQWLVTGTSRGYVALWDIRFQQAAKLFRHSRGAKICRAATSFVPPPQQWGLNAPATTGARPFVFLGTTSNECGMFDVVDGSCRECFRTVSGDGGLESSLQATQEIPSLLDVPISPRYRNGALCARAGDQLSAQPQQPYVTPSTSINCMVGSVGGRGQCFLLTGGSDGRVRFWDFASPSRCYIAAGGSGIDASSPSSSQRDAFRPSFERVDFDSQRRLMVCRQPSIPSSSSRRSSSTSSSKQHRMSSRKADQHHTDSIQDIKIIDSKALISCSRDCTVKVWR